jgi:tagaturonate reductase
LKTLSRKSANVNQHYPQRILQFGGGNFLRGFVDWIIHKYNVQSNDDKLGIVVAKVLKNGSYQDWNAQDGLYHLFTKGYVKGKTVNEKTLITSVVRILEVHNEYDEFLKSAHQPPLNIIISNTTETGLNFSSQDKIGQIPSTFPGQLTLWLFERYKHFEGDKKAGCTIIPCELLDKNGEVLKSSILKYVDHWNLDKGFADWLNQYCHFCNTLVDRIVPGINKENIEEYYQRIGYEDGMMTEGEPYHLWAIETKHDISAKLPLDRIGLNVVYTKDLSPYKELKLKILNGAHTSMVPVGLLLNIDLVKEAINDAVLGKFIEDLITEEILPSVEIDPEIARTFANDVIDRFKNPFLEHQLKSISLYSISKFNTRVKPTLKSYLDKTGELPKRIMISFACLLIYYSGSYQGKEISPNDQDETISRIKNHWEGIRKGGDARTQSLENLLSDKHLWNEDLTKLEGFTKEVSLLLSQIIEGNLKELIVSK